MGAVLERRRAAFALVRKIGVERIVFTSLGELVTLSRLRSTSFASEIVVPYIVSRLERKLVAFMLAGKPGIERLVIVFVDKIVDTDVDVCVGTNVADALVLVGKPDDVG